MKDSVDANDRNDAGESFMRKENVSDGEEVANDDKSRPVVACEDGEAGRKKMRCTGDELVGKLEGGVQPKMVGTAMLRRKSDRRAR